jgi:hypothetical protein
MYQEWTDTTDALNFNNLVIGAESATKPIEKKVTNVKLFTFFISFLNIFELFVTKILHVTFSGRNFPRSR